MWTSFANILRNVFVCTSQKSKGTYTIVLHVGTRNRKKVDPDFLGSLLNIWKDFEVLSRFIQNWIQPPACSDHGLYRILSSIGWRTLIRWKNPPKCCTILVWIAGCWNSSNILLTSRNLKKNNCWLSRIFEARFGGKRARFVRILIVIQTSRQLDSYLYETAQNF